MMRYDIYNSDVYNGRIDHIDIGSATEVEVDTIGRILLPEFLVTRASLRNKVAVVGLQNRIEIWNEDAWREYKNVVEKKADQLAEKLGQAGAL